MSARPATPDLFAPIAGVDVLAGLELLARSPPLWPHRDVTRWSEIIADVKAFELRWGGPARAGGWSLTQLYGLDPVAPYARVGRMGGAFLASLRAHRVVGVDAGAIHLVARTAARLRIYRGDDQGAVVAWEINAPACPTA